jgi:hypothetical protein
MVQGCPPGVRHSYDSFSRLFMRGATQQRQNCHIELCFKQFAKIPYEKGFNLLRPRVQAGGLSFNLIAAKLIIHPLDI